MYLPFTFFLVPSVVAYTWLNGTQTSNSSTVATKADVLEVIDALGGLDALNAIQGFTYNGGDIYRSATLTQSYNLAYLDQSVATTGSSDMSFQFNSSALLSRIDRTYSYDGYWIWAIPTLQPLVNMSVVVSDAEQQYACFVQRTNTFELPLNSTQGYTDALVTNYLIHQARQFALPWLLKTFYTSPSKLTKYQIEQSHTSVKLNALEDHKLGLILLSDPKTNLPYAVRSPENHTIYGPSTSDIVFTNMQPVAVNNNLNFTFPHRLQTVYNAQYVLEDFLLDSVTINPPFPDDFFAGKAPTPDPNNDMQGLQPVAPQTSTEYQLSEVHEFYEAGIWPGAFTEQYNTSDVVIEYPDPTFRNIMKLYIGYEDYVQMLVEHEKGFIITDAPPHRSRIILEWLEKTRPGKRITHVVPTHHHGDHADGVIDYVQAGATLVVPDVARDYYQQGQENKSDWSIVTYDEKNPFVLKDKLVDFRSFWAFGGPHTQDQAFPVATKANATDSDVLILFEADILNPGSAAVNFNSIWAWDLLIRATRIGIPRSALVMSTHIHGQNTTGVSSVQPLTVFGDSVGFSYPDLKMRDWWSCLAKGCQM